MNVTIRPVREEEFPELIVLFKEFAAFEKATEHMTNSTEQLLEDKDHFNCFVAVKEGSLVGYATYFHAYSSWSGKSLYMDDLYVKRNYRKQGIGKLLLGEIVSLAKEHQCKKVHWQVSDWNVNAQDFYKALGAKVSADEWNCDLWLL